MFQVETMSMRDTVKIPVAVLKAGETRQVRLDLEFPDAPVTFTLVQVRVFYFYGVMSIAARKLMTDCFRVPDQFI